MCSRFDPASRRYEDAGVASVLFRRYFATRYGWPNDEAIMGHPLYPKGLVRADGVGEVHNSQWLKTVQLRNNLSFPRADPSTQYASMRHFVFEFKEHLFECLAPSIDVAVQREPFDSALARATTESWLREQQEATPGNGVCQLASGDPGDLLRAQFDCSISVRHGLPPMNTGPDDAGLTPK